MHANGKDEYTHLHFCLPDCPAPMSGLFCNDTCPSNCLDGECDRYNQICSSCVDDFWGDRCNYTCGQCRGDKCNQANGTCPNGCDDGYYGDRCMSPCTHDGCQTCNSTGECILCKQGKWSVNCDLDCSPNCVPDSTDFLIYCDKVDAACMSNECQSGYTQQDCAKACNTHCGMDQNGTKPCDMNTERCLVDSCELTWYGPTCNARCPSNCINQHCNRTGDCLEGCKVGYWGPKCDNICQRDNTCNDDTCDQVEGRCLECDAPNPTPRCRTAGTILVEMMLAFQCIMKIKELSQKERKSIGNVKYFQ